MTSQRTKGILFVIAIVLALITWGFWPRAELAQTGSVARRPLAVTVEEEGRTRVRDRYVLSAPVAGYLRRIDLEVGDPAASGEVLATLDPLRPAALDERSRAEAEARVAAARAGLAERESDAKRAAAEAELAASEFARTENLLERSLVSRAQFDEARSRKQASAAASRAATAAVDVGRYDLEAALASLRYTASGKSTEKVEAIPVRSPVTGRVLAIHQESAGVVAAGQPLLDVGDAGVLEIVVELLSRDAVRVSPGGRVLLERWGGPSTLEGIVRTVEPTGFTKVSALGVEEQRVRVIVDFSSPPDAWTRLGDGYRVEATFIVWSSDDALTVPSSALFRRDGGWAAFVVTDGRAREKTVTPGHSSGLLTEVLEGLEDGDTVIVHPGDAIEDGVRVRSFRPR